MRANRKFRYRPTSGRRSSERGYLLITLMLIVALAAIATLEIVPTIRQQYQRDQEAELRHRGTEYMRAIQHFYKRFGRYPTRVEELENTNNIRCLRKRFKDPMLRDPQTGKERDFKLLHMQDIPLNSGIQLSAAAGGMQAGILAQAGAVAGGGAQGGLQSAINQLGGPQAAMAQLGAMQGALSQTGQIGGLQGNINGNQPASGQSNATGDNGGNSDATSGSSPLSSSPSSSSSSSGSNPNGQVFGGGPILGVASTSKSKSIREFDHKNHYNDWYFIYDPTLDRGGLLVGPYQTGMQMGNMGGVAPGNLGQGAPGQAPGFGQGIGSGQGIGGPGFNPPNQSPQVPQPPQNQDTPNNN
jgi:hypothetical protein